MAEWDQANISRLRQLWAEGVSTAWIARAMGFSKNAIVGKAHRLNLPKRPSPIRHGAAGPRPVQPPRAPRVTLPRLASIAVPEPRPVMPRAVPPPRPSRVCDAPVAPAAAAPWKPPTGDRGCQYITRFDDARPSRSDFCGADRTDADCSWCAKHRSVVFERRLNAYDAFMVERLGLVA